MQHKPPQPHCPLTLQNIIFAEEERRFKLIDLGACADLRTGTNYVPDESILDPNYCPPEQAWAPHVTKPRGDCCKFQLSRPCANLCASLNVQQVSGPPAVPVALLLAVSDHVPFTVLQYCMPTDAPHLAKAGMFKFVMSPLLWKRFKPDRFDSYSAGVTAQHAVSTATGSPSSQEDTAPAHYLVSALECSPAAGSAFFSVPSYCHHLVRLRMEGLPPTKA